MRCHRIMGSRSRVTRIRCVVADGGRGFGFLDAPFRVAQASNASKIPVMFWIHGGGAFETWSCLPYPALLSPPPPEARPHAAQTIATTRLGSALAPDLARRSGNGAPTLIDRGPIAVAYADSEQRCMTVLLPVSRIYERLWRRAQASPCRCRSLFLRFDYYVFAAERWHSPRRPAPPRRAHRVAR